MHRDTDPATPGHLPARARAHARKRPSSADQRVEYLNEVARLYAEHHRRLLGVTAATKVAWWAVEEGCSFAWMQLCRADPMPPEPIAWLTVVARREAIRLARRALRETATEGVGEALADVHDIELARAAREALISVARLPDRQRRPFELKLAGYSYAEIQAELGWSYSQVNRHLVRARRRLRERARAV